MQKKVAGKAETSIAS